MLRTLGKDGLAIVQRIMAAHLRRVTVRSQVSVGTAFMLFLPLPPRTLGPSLRTGSDVDNSRHSSHRVC